MKLFLWSTPVLGVLGVPPCLVARVLVGSGLVAITVNVALITIFISLQVGVTMPCVSIFLWWDPVWSLTQFYSVDFSKSRIDGVFNKRTIKVCVRCC